MNPREIADTARRCERHIQTLLAPADQDFYRAYAAREIGKVLAREAELERIFAEIEAAMRAEHP